VAVSALGVTKSASSDQIWVMVAESDAGWPRLWQAAIVAWVNS
jgi:hypothetical protein